MTVLLVTVLRCDRCLIAEHRASPGLGSPFAVRSEARSAGWTGTASPAQDICPACTRAQKPAVEA